MSSTTEELIQDDDQNTSEAGKPQPQRTGAKALEGMARKDSGFIKKLFA